MLKLTAHAKKRLRNRSRSTCSIKSVRAAWDNYFLLGEPTTSDEVKFPIPGSFTRNGLPLYGVVKRGRFDGDENTWVLVTVLTANML